MPLTSTSFAESFPSATFSDVRGKQTAGKRGPPDLDLSHEKRLRLGAKRLRANSSSSFPVDVVIIASAPCRPRVAAPAETSVASPLVASSSAPAAPQIAQGGDASDSLDPSSLTCPITLDLLVDPVLAEDGYTYERSAIERYIRRCASSSSAKKNTSSSRRKREKSSVGVCRARGGSLMSPVTREPMGPLLVPNARIRSAIDRLLRSAGDDAANPLPPSRAPSSSTLRQSVAVSDTSIGFTSQRARDAELVRQTLHRARAHRDPEAMYDLGSWHYRGTKGLARNKGRGYGWFKRAANAGSIKGMAAAGALALNGAGVGANGGSKKQRGWDTDSRKLRSTSSGSSGSRTEDDQGHRQKNRHHCHRHHHASGNYAEGMALLGSAAASGSALASYWLGQCYHEGTYGLAANRALARHWLEKVVGDDCPIRDLNESLLRRAGEYLVELDEMEDEDEELDDVIDDEEGNQPNAEIS